MLALVTFGIRLHRVDDYRGRYRVWLWTAAGLAWASLDAATSIHDAVGLGLATAAGQTLATIRSPRPAPSVGWPSMASCSGRSRFAWRLKSGARFSRWLALAVAGLLYLLAGLGALDMLPATGPLVDSVVRTSIVLMAHVSLVSAIALYARHVYLDATGRLKVHIDPDKKRGVKKPKAKLKVVKADKDDADDRPAARPAASAEKQAGGVAPQVRRDGEQSAESRGGDCQVGGVVGRLRGRGRRGRRRASRLAANVSRGPSAGG